MRTRLSLVSFLCCLILVAIVGTANSVVEPIIGPTRLKVRGSGENYIDVTKYLSLNGKSRLGKRRDLAPRMSELTAAWETLKMILSAQMQQQRQERLKQSKERETVYGKLPHGSGGDEQHTSRVLARLGYPLDAVGKYYYDVQ